MNICCGDADEDRDQADLAIGSPVEASARILARPSVRESFACIVRHGHRASADAVDLKAFVVVPHLVRSPEGDRAGPVDQKLDAALDRRRSALVRFGRSKTIATARQSRRDQRPAVV